MDSVELPQKRWTREECTVLESVGLVELQRYELIEGKLIRKLGKNHPHTRTLTHLVIALRTIFEALQVIQEPSIDVAPEDNPTSEPEPDCIVLRQSIDEFDRRARPEDLLLVVEISDTTLEFDLISKAALYARAKIREYWVLDVKARRLVAHRNPLDGQYQTILAYSEDELVAPLAAPDRSVAVRDLL